MIEKKDRQLGILFLLTFLLLAFFVPQYGHFYDTRCWSRWSTHIFEQGFFQTYSSTRINYPPLYMYILNWFGNLQGSVQNISENIHFLKIFTLLFDFGGVILAAWWLRLQKIDPFVTIFLLFNIAYLYNTYAWGQVDAIHTCFAFAALLAALKKWPVASLLLYVLALNAKLQVVIFFPPLALLWLLLVIEKPRSLLIGMPLAALLQFVIIYPFWSTGYLPRIIDVVFGSVDFYPVVSMNAFNLWHLFLEGDLMKMPDTETWLGFTYKTWGMGLFFLTSALTLVPFLIRILGDKLGKRSFDISFQALAMLVCGLIPVLFFFFNTQMHERYVHPALLFLAMYAFLSKDYWPYIFVSFAYFLNMEKVLEFLHLTNYKTLVFDERFIAALFLLGIVWSLWKVWKLSEMKASFARIREELKTSA